MTLSEIIDVQLDSFFGARFPVKMQALIDNELNNGRWVDGYDIAVSSETISIGEAQQLLDMVLGQHPEWRLDEETLTSLVDEYLPQSCAGRVKWIVDESGSYALTDSLRVARFDMLSLVWVSPRISYDGIEFDSLAEGVLKGGAWFGSSNVNPDSPFEIDFDTGEMLKGEVIR